MKKSFFRFTLTKEDGDEVDVTVCYYHLAPHKDRYVFFFYDPTEKSPIYKWAYYLIDENYKEMKKKYKEMLKEKNFSPNKDVRLCMCNQSTKINTFKIPKTLKYTMKYKTLIMDDLKEKMGSDVKQEYLIDNKVEGLEEKKADALEKKVFATNSNRKARVDKRKKKIDDAEKEYYFATDKQNKAKVRGFDIFYIGGPLLMIGFIIAFILLNKLGFKQNYILYSFISIEALLFAGLVVKIVFAIKKRTVSEEPKPKWHITYKELIDIVYIVLTAIFLYGTLFMVFFLYQDKVPEIMWNIYGPIAFVYVLTIFICERLKRLHLSKLCEEIHRKPREERMVYYQEQDEDDEELFEGSMNENKLFNMSKTKVKITKSKKKKASITYRQLLVPRESYKAATKMLSNLGLSVKTLRTLPSLIASFHRKYSKGVNEIIAYNEAGFTFLIGFVNDEIVDCMFIDGSDRTKLEDGATVDFHLSAFKNVFSSLLWSCQRETSNMDRVVYISNTEKNINAFKKENLYGLPYEIVPTTDIIFGESARRVKAMALFRAFTLVETVVALAVFSITASIVATLTLSINRFNRNMSDTTNALIYVNNVTEVFNGDISDSTIEAVTAYEIPEGNYETTGKYYLNEGLSVFNPSKTPGNSAYFVDFSLSKVVVPGSYTHVTFTIKKITRTNEKRELVKNVKIEVAR